MDSYNEGLQEFPHLNHFGLPLQRYKYNTHQALLDETQTMKQQLYENEVAWWKAKNQNQ